MDHPEWHGSARFGTLLPSRMVTLSLRRAGDNFTALQHARTEYLDSRTAQDKLVPMRQSLHSLLLLSALVLLVGSVAIAADDKKQALLGVDELKRINELPDPFLMKDGSHVKTRQDWDRRRQELREMIMGYEYGNVPAETSQVSAAPAPPEPQQAANVKRFTLKVGPDGQVAVPLVLSFPDGNGLFPIIIKGDLCWGRVKAPIVSDIISRGYILAEFDRTALAPDSNDRTHGVFPLYPNSDWGDLAAWAWGFGRVVDYVSTRPDVDKTKIIVTGHSRGGKAALLAGVLDERVALTVPNGSGAGGAGCFRIGYPLTESLWAIQTRFPYWFVPSFGQFIGHVDQLPFDQHEVKALVAPRALLTTDSLDDLWANPMGTQVSFLAAREVYKFLGVPDKIGLHYRHGKHEQNEEDFAALLDFADWQLMGKTATQKFDALPFAKIPITYKWKAPSSQ